MGGFITWIGVGIAGITAGYEGVLAHDPEKAAVIVGATTLVVGVARKVEKVLRAIKGP